MDLDRLAVVITYLVGQMRIRGSWCGETHIQKAAYFAKYLAGVPLDYRFVFYKYGPYAIDLDYELANLCGEGLLESRTVNGSAPKFSATKRSERFRKRFQVTLRKNAPALEFVADLAGDRDHLELERLSSVLYFRRKLGWSAAPYEVAKPVIRLTPYISEPDAAAAYEEIGEARQRALQRGFPVS